MKHPFRGDRSLIDIDGDSHIGEVPGDGTVILGLAEKSATLRMVVLGSDFITNLGLSHLLSGVDFIDVRATVPESPELLALLATEDVDLVLIDATMQQGTRAQTCRAVSRLESPPTVVVMGEVPVELAETLVLAGVSAILYPGLISEDLPMALRMIHRGGAILLTGPDREALVARSNTFDVRHRSSFDALNHRERLVARGVAEGKTNAELAACMHLSQASVKLLVSSVMAKLGAANRVQVAVAVTKARVV